MEHKVRLVFHNDDATGDWGLIPAGTIDNNGVSFNSFWNAIGLFHDVFEHWHEYKHKYFTGKNAMNIGGEMAAMGAMMYFVEEMGLDSERRLSKNNYRPHSDMALSSTVDEIEETIKYGYVKYGDTLESGVPYQPPTPSEIEFEIKERWEKLKGWRYHSPRTKGDMYDDERASSKRYRQSVSLSKIQRLHRWGYWEAQRRFPRNNHNINVLIEFIEFWEEFTKRNSAEEVQQYFKTVIFNVTKHKKEIKWTATFMGDYDVKDYRISSTNLPYDLRIDDMIVDTSVEY